MIATGKVWKYGDNINTDVIFPGRYTYRMLKIGEHSQFALADLDPAFNQEAKEGDFIVAGENWGIGSAREQAVRCIKERGIRGIIAKSFNRIYYRNAINEGFPAIICPEAVDKIETADIIIVDFEKSEIITDNARFEFKPYNSFIKSIIDDGGLLAHTRNQLLEQGIIK